MERLTLTQKVVGSSPTAVVIARFCKMNRLEIEQCNDIGQLKALCIEQQKQLSVIGEGSVTQGV